MLFFLPAVAGSIRYSGQKNNTSQIEFRLIFYLFSCRQLLRSPSFRKNYSDLSDFTGLVMAALID